MPRGSRQTSLRAHGRYVRISFSPTSPHNIILLVQGTADFMSIEVRDQEYHFAPLEKIVRAAMANLDEVDAMRMDAFNLAQKPRAMIDQEHLIKPWFYNPLHDVESILWIFARQVLYQDHYLQRFENSTVDYVTVPIDDTFVRFPATEDPEDRTRRIKAYSALGHGLFVSHASRKTFLMINQRLLQHLVDHPLLPAARPLGVALKNMRNDLVREYTKWEGMDEINCRCAEEVHLMFVDWLKWAYEALSSVEGGEYTLMARWLQSEMAMIRDREAMAPSTNSTSGSSKRSRSDAEDEKFIAKSPRTESSRSPHQHSVCPLPVSPPPPPPAPIRAPKRKARAVSLPTRTLRSHAPKTVKTDSATEPTIPPLPPAPVLGQGKATKNNGATRAEEKVKNTTRKGR